jgi:hypothetical protein
MSQLDSVAANIPDLFSSISQLLTQFFLPGFFALLGAWAGAYTALSRFKGERSFDRRLDWLEGSINSLIEYSVATKELCDSVNMKNWHDIPDQLLSLMKVTHKLQLNLLKAEIYGSRSSVELASAALARIQNILPHEVYQGKNNLVIPELEIKNETEKLKTIISLIEPTTSLLLAQLYRDVRSHLNLEPIK